MGVAGWDFVLRSCGAIWFGGEDGGWWVVGGGWVKRW